MPNRTLLVEDHVAIADAVALNRQRHPAGMNAEKEYRKRTALNRPFVFLFWDLI